MRITGEAEAAVRSFLVEEISSEAEASAVAASEVVWAVAVEPVPDSKTSSSLPQRGEKE